MKEEKLFETMGEIDEKYILEAEEEPLVSPVSHRKRRRTFIRILAAAAGIALIASGSLYGFMLSGNKNYVPNERVDAPGVLPTQSTLNPDKTDREPGDLVQKPEESIPWTPLSFASPEQFRASMERRGELGNISSIQTYGKEDLTFTRDFFTALRMERNVIPYMKGEEMTLGNIVFYLRGDYGLPWVYFRTNDDAGTYIKITLIPSEYSATIGETASGLLKKIAPEAVNIGQPGPDNRNIYEREIKLQDRTVTALVHEYFSDDRNGYLFIYNQMLVWVCCNPEILGEGWFADLGFGK